MPRHAKTISLAEFYYVGRLRGAVPPISWRTCAARINDGRQVHLKSGLQRRDLTISHELLRQIYQRMARDIRQETNQSRNAAAAEARTRQETQRALAARRTEPQRSGQEEP